MRLRMNPLLAIVVAFLWTGAAFAAIAPSKLGDFIAQTWSSADARSDDVTLRRLRKAGLVRPFVRDIELMAVFRNAREEDLALAASCRPPCIIFNGPAEEKIRVSLGPFLSDKGRLWAVPLQSLDLPDDSQYAHWPEAVILVFAFATLIVAWLHWRNGERNSYGNDPHPPKG